MDRSRELEQWPKKNAVSAKETQSEQLVSRTLPLIACFEVFKRKHVFGYSKILNQRRPFLIFPLEDRFTTLYLRVAQRLKGVDSSWISSAKLIASAFKSPTILHSQDMQRVEKRHDAPLLRSEITCSLPLANLKNYEQ